MARDGVLSLARSPGGAGAFPGPRRSRPTMSCPSDAAAGTLPAMPVVPSPPLRWPSELCRALAALRAAPAGGRATARAALWPILHAALFAALRAQSGRVGGGSREDLEDLASQKALELLTRAEEGTWDVAGRADHEVTGYVARVARHGLVDLARRRGRECPAPEDDEAWAVTIAERSGEPVRPDERLAAREFAAALGVCLEALAPRARQAWYLRVFLERPSREIAARLGVTAAHVDVIVQRARTGLRECMRAKGHADAEYRPGAFADVWCGLERASGVSEAPEDDRAEP